MHQSEAVLENNLIKQLNALGYDSVQIHDGDALFSNLQQQLEAFNKTTFSFKEFGVILNHLAKGNVFEKAKTLFPSGSPASGTPRNTNCISFERGVPFRRLR